MQLNSDVKSDIAWYLKPKNVRIVYKLKNLD